MENLLLKSESELKKTIKLLQDVYKRLEKGSKKLKNGFDEKIEKPLLDLAG